MAKARAVCGQAHKALATNLNHHESLSVFCNCLFRCLDYPARNQDFELEDYDEFLRPMVPDLDLYQHIHITNDT